MNRVINIETTSDTYECKTCGMGWAEGGYIFLDGVKVDEFEPLAHCYGGQSASSDEILLIALAHMGIDVTVDGERVHINNIELSDRRDKILGVCTK